MENSELKKHHLSVILFPSHFSLTLSIRNKFQIKALVMSHDYNAASQYGFYRLLKNQSDCIVASLNSHIFQHHIIMHFMFIH